MTTVRYDPDRLRVTVSGHAGAAPMGKDIVCAGLSALFQVLALTAQRCGGSADYDGDAAYAELLPDSEPVLEAVTEVYALLAEEFPDHVRYVQVGGIEPGQRHLIC